MVTFSAPFLRQGSKAEGTPLVLGIQPPTPMVCFMLHVPLHSSQPVPSFPFKTPIGHTLSPATLTHRPTHGYFPDNYTRNKKPLPQMHTNHQQHTSLLHSHYQLEYSLALSNVPIIEEQLQKHILILLQKTHLPAFSLTSSLTQTNPVVKMT